MRIFFHHIILFILILFGFVGCGATASDSYNKSIPPIPNATENSKTISGIDTNNNQVRDDVENFILTTYTNEPEQKALVQTASVIQKALLEVNTKTDVQNYYQEMSKAQACTKQVFGSDSKEYNQIRAKTLNTMDIVRKDLEISLLMSGEVFTDTWSGNPCE